MQVEDEDAVVVDHGREEGERFGRTYTVVAAEVHGVEHASAACFAILSAQRKRVRSSTIGRHYADDLSAAVVHERHGDRVAHERKSVTIHENMASLVPVNRFLT